MKYKEAWRAIEQKSYVRGIATVLAIGALATPPFLGSLHRARRAQAVVEAEQSRTTPLEIALAPAAINIGETIAKRADKDNIPQEFSDDHQVKGGVNIVIHSSDGNEDYDVLVSMKKISGEPDPSTTYQVIAQAKNGQTGAIIERLSILAPQIAPQVIKYDWYAAQELFSVTQPGNLVSKVDTLVPSAEPSELRAKKISGEITALAAVALSAQPLSIDGENLNLPMPA